MPWLSNGTVYLPAANLTVQQCALGVSGTTCSGTASTYQYCGTADDQCNGGNSLGEATASSPAHAACAGSAVGGRSGWRLPEPGEAAAFLEAYFANVSIVPNALSVGEWTRRSHSASAAFAVNPQGLFHGFKTTLNRARCYLSGP